MKVKEHFRRFFSGIDKRFLLKFYLVYVKVTITFETGNLDQICTFRQV